MRVGGGFWPVWVGGLGDLVPGWWGSLAVLERVLVSLLIGLLIWSMLYFYLILSCLSILAFLKVSQPLSTMFNQLKGREIIVY